MDPIVDASVSMEVGPASELGILQAKGSQADGAQDPRDQRAKTTRATPTTPQSGPNASPWLLFQARARWRTRCAHLAVEIFSTEISYLSGVERIG